MPKAATRVSALLKEVRTGTTPVPQTIIILGCPVLQATPYGGESVSLTSFGPPIMTQPMTASTTRYFPLLTACKWQRQALQTTTEAVIKFESVQ